jgi:hypothetical protein
MRTPNLRVNRNSAPRSAWFSAALLISPLASLLLLGCTDDKPPKEDLGLPGVDLAVPQPDMSISRPDLAGGAADLAGGAGDLAGPVDLAGGRSDLAGPGDMGGGTPDLAMPPRDMGAGPVVTGLPTCTDTGITADVLFTTLARSSCAVTGDCHSKGDGGLTFTSGATLKSALVGIASKQTTVVPLVTAGDVDRSYLMYKLTNQQATVMGRGGIMPRGAGRLSDANLCKFIVWIKEGAK